MDKFLTPEYFRKVGLEAVIADFLPAIKEAIIGGKEQNANLEKELEVERAKNDELHKVIATFAKEAKS